MSKPNNHRLKLVGFLAIPIILALGIRVYYISSPQYAVKSFLAAIRSGDTERATYLSTPRFIAEFLTKDQFFYFFYYAWEKDTQRSHRIVWSRSDATHADVTYYMKDGRHSYYLLKTHNGWKLDRFDASMF